MARSRMVVTTVLLAALAAAPAFAQGTPVAVRFAAVVGGKTFACGQQYDGIGTTRSTVSVTDLRFYVSNVRLVRADGAEVAVALTEDGLWQSEGVALLDFEDGSATCASGTPELRDVVEGTVAPGTYTGVRFDLGVPFAQNHREPTVSPSPLNLTRMFWSWNAGYKFARIDLRTTGQPKGWMVHLGSTGCEPGGQPSVVPVSCKHPNRVAVDLAGFDVARDVVQFDLAALLAGANVDVNQEKTAMGCMSGRDDQECTPVLRALGLIDGSGGQTVFRARGAGTAAAPER
ncbi:MAG: metallo-mystery pair system four-Cys motif protein [Vicinamibacterales bacterium]